MKALALTFVLFVQGFIFTSIDANAASDNFDDLKQKIDAAVKKSNNHQLPNSIYYGSFLLQACSILENAYYYPGGEGASDAADRRALLEKLVSQYVANIGKNGDELRLSTENVVNDIEHGKGESYLKLSEPSLMVQERQDNAVVLYFSGYFNTLDLEKTYLEVNGNKIKPAHKTDNSLSFSTNWTTLGLPANSNKIDHIVGKLVLEYEGKKARSKKGVWTDEYTIMIGLIPSGPGNLAFSNTVQANAEELQQKTTRNFLQHSSNGDIVENYCIPEHQGWEIVPGSAQLIIDASSGREDQDWFVNQYSRSGKSCFTVETLYNGYGNSGKLSFHIVYEIRRTALTASQSQRKAVIDWGESIVFDIYSPDWKLKLNAFTGNYEELSRGKQKSGLLELRVYGNTVRVTALNLKDLIHPQ